MYKIHIIWLRVRCQPSLYKLPFNRQPKQISSMRIQQSCEENKSITLDLQCNYLAWVYNCHKTRKSGLFSSF